MNVKGIRLLLAGAGVLFVAWVLPPFAHMLSRLCPVRPDGVNEASALPSFARKYKMSCMQCHTAFPVLNDYGRQFKMNGYVKEPGGTEGVLQSQDLQLWTEGSVPWNAIIRSRPLDNGKGSISNQGAQMGGTASPNPNGFKMQPINDVDLFIAGGDAANRVSYLGEMDANAGGDFATTVGDLRLGYHPFSALNLVAARRGFFADDPYQTIVSNESPTIANRATDLLMADQGSITGNTMLPTQQVLSVYGQAPLAGQSFLYYAAGATKESNVGSQNSSPTNGAARLAFDAGNGMMVGAFGSYGHERPSTWTPPGIGGNLGVDNGVGGEQEFERGGFDALWEAGGLAARGAILFARDRDPITGDRASDRAAYAELAYAFKRGSADYPFLMPLVRENWYTTFNGTQEFTYVTAQLAHFFKPNVKGFVEYSADTKAGHQGGTLADPTTSSGGASLALPPLGNRVTVQVEVGF